MTSLLLLTAALFVCIYALKQTAAHRATQLEAIRELETARELDRLSNQELYAYDRISAKCKFRGYEPFFDQFRTERVKIDRGQWRFDDEAGVVQARWNARKLARNTVKLTATRAVRL